MLGMITAQALVPPDAELGEEERALRAWLDALFLKPGFELPRPPAAALEIAKLTRLPNARIEDMALVLEREPLLAGRVLRLANSAMYGATAPCKTLKQALIRIGVERVRDVVMEAAMLMTVIHAPGFESLLDQVRRHSAAVAWLSRAVARHTSLESENAFLVGLLHDVGLSVGLVGVCEFLKQTKQPSVLTWSRWRAVERLHEHFGSQMLANWGLGPEVRTVVRHHHTLHSSGSANPSVAVLLVAERLANVQGWGVTPAFAPAGHGGIEGGSDAEFERALAEIELTPRQFEMLRGDSERVLATLAAQFKDA